MTDFESSDSDLNFFEFFSVLENLQILLLQHLVAGMKLVSQRLRLNVNQMVVMHRLNPLVEKLNRVRTLLHSLIVELRVIQHLLF